MTTYDPDSTVGRHEITPAWMTALLRHHSLLGDAHVTHLESEAFGTGQVADSLRFSLEYSVPSSGPATIVAKLPSSDTTSREFAISLGLYETEIRFYREIAGSLPISVPRSLHAAVNPAGEFTLVMEDLAPAETLDQLAGAPVDRIARAVEQLATMHAATWQDSRLAGLPWLQSVVRGFEGVIDQLGDLTAGLTAKFGDVIPDEDFAELRKFVAVAGPWKARLNEVRCLWHQDYRLDNMLFGARDGALPIVIVDWQTVGMANGVIDLPYVIASGLTVDDRREHERDLVDLYHQVLTAHGVEGFDREEAWRDYRELAAHGLAGLAVGAIGVQRTPRGDEMWRIWASRHAAQTRDHQTFELLAEGRGLTVAR